MTTSAPPRQLYGCRAEFESAADLDGAWRALVSNGYRAVDRHTPYQLATAHTATPELHDHSGWLALAGGVLGASAGLAWQWLVRTPADQQQLLAAGLGAALDLLPAAIAPGALGGVLGAAAAALRTAGLPALDHPLLRNRHPGRTSGDRFALSILASDPKFDPQRTASELIELAARSVHMIEQEPT